MARKMQSSMLKPESAIEQADHRAKDYWLSDGIPALVFGAAYIVLFLEVCAIFVLLYLLPHVGSNWLWLFNSAFVASPVAVILSLVWFGLWHEDIIEFIKSRITYPRTGYVAPPSYWTEKEVEGKTEEPPETLPGVVLRWIDRLPIFESGLGRMVRACLRILFWVWVLGIFEPSWLPPKLRWIFISTLVLPSPSRFRKFRSKLAHDKRQWIKVLDFPLYVLAVLAVLLLLWKQHPTVGMVLFLLSPGALVMLGGAIDLVRYLRRNPLPRT
jgi:hypothetical protein